MHILFSPSFVEGRPHLARYALLISLAAVSFTSSIVGARTDGSVPPLPGAPPTTEQTTIDQCRQQYSALRLDVDAKAEPIRDASRGRVSAYAVCQLLTAYEEAELRLISFVETNSNRCSISNEISEKIRTTNVTTERMKAEACRKTR
jgi:hypothetical protein